MAAKGEPEIVDTDKSVLLDNLNELEFLDNVEKWKCERCSNVLINNYKANCGHLFCLNCKEYISQRNDISCPKCKQLITQINQNDIDVETGLYDSKVNCLNKKYGCKDVVFLRNLTAHYLRCKNTRDAILPAIFTGKNSMNLIMKTLGEISVQVNQTKVDISEIKKDSNTQIVELRNECKTINENFKKLSEDLLPNNGLSAQNSAATGLLQNITTKLDQMGHNFEKLFVLLDNNLNGKSSNTNYANRTQTINILLLGESGSGKSTFCNAVASFYLNKTFEEARSSDQPNLIPTKIVVTDQDYDEIKITPDRADSNENMAANQSSTRKCKNYLFQVQNRLRLRFIDSPGFGSTWGPQHDDESVNDVIDCVAQLDELHVIAVVLKGSQPFVTTKFEYCVQQMLTFLPKNVLDNIVFIFTGGNKPGDSLIALKEAFKNIKDILKVDIPVNKNNVFAFENEGFNIATALRKGVAIDEKEIGISEGNWNSAKTEFERFLEHSKTLSPFEIRTLVDLNEVRIFLAQVIKVLETETSNLKGNEVAKGKDSKKTPVGTRTSFPKSMKRSTSSDMNLNQTKNENKKLFEVIAKCNSFITNNAILHSNLKLREHVETFNKSVKMSAEATNKMMADKFVLHLNESSKSTDEIEVVPISEIRALREDLGLSGAYASKFAFIFNLKNSRNAKGAGEIVININ